MYSDYWNYDNYRCYLCKEKETSERNATRGDGH